MTVEDKELYGSLDPARGNPLAHKRADSSITGSAGGKVVNRVQDCHPALRGDFRERWYGEKHGLPAPEVQSDVKSVGLQNIANNLGPNHHHQMSNSGLGLQGSSDQKMVNRSQSCHPVLRDDQSYRRDIRVGGAPRGGALSGNPTANHPRTQGHYGRAPVFGGGATSMEGSSMQRAHTGARNPRSTPDTALRRMGSMSALELYRPAPIDVLSSPGSAPAPMWASATHPLTVPPATADAAQEGGKASQPVQAYRARRELCAVKANHQRSPPLPPSLSRLTPVPTLSWNGTTGRHPKMPSYRSQGLWHEEQDFAGPLKLHSPLSPGSGSVLTPGIGAPFDDRRGGRLLRPMVVTDDKWKTAGYNADLSRLSSPDKVMIRAGGGGAGEMRQRTKGDRIWLSGNSWMSFS